MLSMSEAVSPRAEPGTIVVAEIGTAHGGDAAKGRELVAAAVEAGAQVVKFQHVYAAEIIHPATGMVPLPGGPVALYERFVALQTSPVFLAEMKSEVEARGAVFLCTPFGLRSARELRDLGVTAMKVASPELNHLPLLDEVAGYGLPVILSTGVSTLGDIEEALSRFRVGGVALLHCVTAYPAPEEDYNLALVPLLAGLLGVPVGVSDHSMDPVLVPALAAARGARFVEKHICLSRRDEGLDDPIALPPEDFRRMVDAMREAEQLGREAAEDALAARYGREKVMATLGDGVKRLAPSELANYGLTNRSLHATRAIPAGAAIGPRDVAVLRTEKVLRPGLAPAMLDVVVGRIAARDIDDGQGIGWDDLGARAVG